MPLIVKMCQNRSLADMGLFSWPIGCRWPFCSLLIDETVSNPFDDFGAALKVILFIETVGREIDRVPILDEPQEGDLVKVRNLQSCLALGFGGNAKLGIEVD